jgi:hypothetical protein
VCKQCNLSGKTLPYTLLCYDASASIENDAVTRLQFDAIRVYITQEMFLGAILINEYTVTNCHVVIYEKL